MATLDELVVRIKADASQLERELKRVQGTTQQAAGKMGGAVGALVADLRTLAPALTAAAVVQFGRSAFQAADRINDLAQRIGFMGSTLSALNVPLLQSGSSVDEFSSSVVRMNNMIGEAAKGENQEAVKAFENLGLSVRGLQELSPEQQFFAVADALGRISDRSKLTEAGMNIFGRSFATLIPLLLQAKDGMAGFVEQQKKAGTGLTDEQLRKIDDFGDRWTEAIERIKVAMADAMPALQLYLDGLLGIISLPQNAQDAAIQLGDAVGLVRRKSAPGRAYSDRPAAVSEATVGKGYTFDANGNLIPPSPAGGRNEGLLKPKADPVADYLRNLRQQSELLKMAQPQRAGEEAVMDLRNAAQKEGIKLTREQIDLARELATANYQAQNPDPVEEYIDRLEQERQVMRAGATDREGMKAYFELTNQLRRDGITISEEEKQRIIEMTGANDKLRKSIEEAERQARQMHDELRDGLTDIILHFDSAGDAARRFFDEIASQIIKRKITGPLADSLLGEDGGGGLLGGVLGGFLGGAEAARPSGDFIGPMPAEGGFLSGIGSFLGFADGGRPPVGRPSIVGERGPEIFVPDTAGTIIPNGKGMGGGVTVVNNWYVSPGVQGTVRKELMDAAPGIVSQSVAATLQAMERGGRAAQIVGKRA